MCTTFRQAVALLLTLFWVSLGSGSVQAQERTRFNVAWSIYAGWAPWDYADQSGILKKWADRHGIEIKLTLVDDYVNSIRQYTAGKFDACAMTNMDALTFSAGAGIDSTAILIGDFSNGNDGIVLRQGSTVADLKGRTIYLVKGSVSQYVLARALATAGLSESSLKMVDTSDSRIASTFAAAPASAVVTWKPQLSEVLAMSHAKLVFDSSRLRGEIMDLMVVRTDVARAHPNFARALTGAWYETLSLLQSKDGRELKVQRAMAKSLGTDLDDLRGQLATTKLLSPAEALGVMRSPALSRTMELVRSFSQSSGLLGPGSAAPGVEMPTGTIGDAATIRLRFDDRPTALLVEGRGELSAPPKR